MITLRLIESEAQFVVEALYDLCAVKRKAYETAIQTPGFESLTPLDFGIPKISALIVEIEAKLEAEAT